jgi:trimethylamine--corrinoid protein Co-methyltransferase
MISGAPVEPMDIPLEFRHLHSTQKVLELSDKVPFVFCQGRQRIHDTLDLIAMAKGMDRSGLVEEPSTFTIINSNSPLQYDKPMATGLIEMAKHNQLSMITPFSLAGASHPISLGAANSLAIAEMLAALTLTQLVRPGAPVASAAYTMNVNMQTGSPGFGSPETNKSIQIGSQMARFYGLPIRSSTFTSSPAPDAQAIYESLGMLWASITSGSNLVMHAAGWLEGGLRSSFEKFILDIEMLQMMAKYLEPVEVNDTTLAFEEIKSVGHGGHFFDTENTIKNYSTAFYEPIVATAKNYGQWEEEGSLDATQRANMVYKKALNSYEEPHLEPSIKEAIGAFVIKREEQGGAPIDL